MVRTVGFTNKSEIPILNSSDIDVSLENFPYNLHDSTKNMLLSSIYLTLHCSNLATVTSRKPIRLYGPIGSEIYQEKLTKAVAKHFGARLLVIDSLGTKKIVKESAVGLQQLILNKGSLMSRNRTPVKRFSFMDFIYQSDEISAVDELFQVAANESRYGPMIIYLKSIEDCIFTKERVFESFKYGLENLPKNVAVMTSVRYTVVKSHPAGYNLFTTIDVGQTWDDDNALGELKQQFVQDAKVLREESNISKIRSCLDRRGVCCCDLDADCFSDQTLKGADVEKIVDWAISKHLMSNKIDTSSLGKAIKFVISSQSITYGFEIFKSRNTATKTDNKSKCAVMKLVENFELNSFEKELLDDVIMPKEIGVSFQDVGALDKVKDALKEAVMLPLQRPELFSKGKLTKPCKGILLFGPPGTGKTMIAKAIATESGANFLNVTISRITSMWVGEGEKYVKAVFTLASKLSPCVIFFDEVDCFLGRRGQYNEHEAMRKMKNEFMINWDGLRTNANERVLVLAATNRPFDLDEAVVRRLPRRLMVTLPDAVNREKILKVILENEKMSLDLDLKEVADMTEGYSGGDLKNLCVMAAHCPIKELTEIETTENSSAMAENKHSPALPGGEDIRPLNMGDFKYACQEISASVSSASANMMELNQWNEQYGEGGSRKTKQLSYFI